MKLFVVEDYATVWMGAEATSKSSDKIGTLFSGEVVMLLEPGKSEHRVLTKFGAGYVHVSLVKSIDEKW